MYKLSCTHVKAVAASSVVQATYTVYIMCGNVMIKNDTTLFFFFLQDKFNFLTVEEERMLFRHFEYVLKEFCAKFQPAMPITVVVSIIRVLCICRLLVVYKILLQITLS